MVKTTKILKINPTNPEPELIEEAVAVIKSGGLVAFPTETVYGLGANAFDQGAIKKIYETKGRESDNPLIIHIASEHEIDNVAKNPSPKDKTYMEEFWPGPLTLILKKHEKIPYNVTSGLETVAVRCPKHPVAKALIKSAGPIAAPSANISGKPSPTNAQHVINDLFGKVDIIIDGGPCTVGLESTIVDANQKLILRPGSITDVHLSDFGAVKIKLNLDPENNQQTPTSPGQKHKHYAPNAKTTLVIGTKEKSIEKINELINSAQSAQNIGILTTDESLNGYIDSKVTLVSLGKEGDPIGIAANLYNCLRLFDQPENNHIEQIYIQGHFNNYGLYLPILDRLVRASNYDIIAIEKQPGEYVSPPVNACQPGKRKKRSFM